MGGMSYQPGPDDVRCAACREWFHKALKACPMCDAPQTPPTYPRKAAPGTPPPIISATVSTRTPTSGPTSAMLVEVLASPEEIHAAELGKGIHYLVGLGLCATGVGALVGVPLMIKGMSKPKCTKWVYQGMCPWCGALIESGAIDADRCSFCSRAFLVVANGQSAQWTPY
jgi:hypothetical protein